MVFGGLIGFCCYVLLVLVLLRSNLLVCWYVGIVVIVCA